jgi:signal peptidase I
MESSTTPPVITISKSKSNAREWIEAAIIALLLALFIRTFIVEPFKIPSGSMIPTLLPGDRILVNKFIYGPKIPFTDRYIARIKRAKRGDIVVFKYPKDENMNFIKRVIGIENDKIEIINNQLYINGEKVKSKYVGKYTGNDGGDARDPLALPDEYAEYLGDLEHPIIENIKPQSPANPIVVDKNKIDPQNFGPILVPKNHFFVMGDNRDNSADSRFWGFVTENKIKGKAFMVYWSWPQLKRCFQTIK